MTRPRETTERGAARGRWGWIPWLGLGVAGAVLIAVRLHAYDLPLENDECNYAYIGARLLEGDRLYVDVWDHQPPGVFMLFAGVIALFGDAPEVFRWLACGFSLGSMVLIFAILRRLGRWQAAVAGAVLFAIVSADPGTAGEGCNREIFMNTFILAAWYFVLRAYPVGRAKDPLLERSGRPFDEQRAVALEQCSRSDAHRRWWLFSAGSALGMASLLKTIVAVHWVILAVWITGVAWTSAGMGRRTRKVVANIVVFGAGPCVIWLATFGYFIGTRRWHEFVDAVFLFNLSYSGGADSLFVRFARFFSPPRHPFVFESALAVWVGALGAGVWLVAYGTARRRTDLIAVVLLVLAAYVGVCLPSRFWPHYYYLLVPPAVIAVSLAVGQIAEWVRGMLRSRRVIAGTCTYLLLALFPLSALATEYGHYLSQPLFGITVKRYNSRDFWGRAQGFNVARVTEPGDEIFVFGNDAEIYYYSGRRCASRYTMITGLQAVYAGAKRRRRILMEELRRDPPRLIVVLFDEQPFDEWKAFLAEYYGEPVGWDLHDRTGKPIMFVFARKDRPIERIDWNWDRAEVGGWLPGERR